MLKEDYFIFDKSYIKYIDSHRICLEILGKTPKQLRKNYKLTDLRKKFDYLQNIPESVVISSIDVFRRNYLDGCDALKKAISEKTSSNKSN